MHKMTVARLEPQMRLGKTLFGTHGEVLLTRGSELGAQYVTALRERGFHAVFVQDGIADDVEPLGIGAAVERQLQQLDRDAEVLPGDRLVLGRRMALDRTYLKDPAVGCLLHDIGKMYVDDRILRALQPTPHHTPG